MLLLMTSFTRIVIVLSLLRQSAWHGDIAPNQVIVGLSLFLTLFVMAPVLDKIYVDAYLPFSQDKMSFNEALDKGLSR